MRKLSNTDGQIIGSVILLLVIFSMFWGMNPNETTETTEKENWEIIQTFSIQNVQAENSSIFWNFDLALGTYKFDIGIDQNSGGGILNVGVMIGTLFGANSILLYHRMETRYNTSSIIELTNNLSVWVYHFNVFGLYLEPFDSSFEVIVYESV